MTDQLRSDIQDLQDELNQISHVNPGVDLSAAIAKSRALEQSVGAQDQPSDQPAPDQPVGNPAPTDPTQPAPAPDEPVDQPPANPSQPGPDPSQPNPPAV